MRETQEKLLRVFATKPFLRFASRFGTDDATLWSVLQGAPDADLGGSIYKYRLPRDGEGARGGARVIVAATLRERMVLMYGFEKKDKANISKRDLNDFRKAGEVLLKLTDADLARALTDRTLTEITKGGKA